jgi:hypothetical protein
MTDLTLKWYFKFDERKMQIRQEESYFGEM